MERKQTPSDTRRLASISETELMTGLKRSSIYKALKNGDLRCVRVGRRTLVSVDSVNELAARASAL